MFKKLTLVSLVLIFSGVAVAAEEDLYTRLDVDKDGTINKKEASSNPLLTEKWGELDVNADGMLDQAEFAKFEAVSE
jgi:hypothetical protein